MHINWLKYQICILGCMLTSHARDGSEIQTFGHCGSAGKIEKLGFLIHVNPKHAWISWLLAWCHDMAPTCCGKFFWPTWDKLWCKLLANRSFPQEGSWFREGTCHLRLRNDIRTLPAHALISLHVQIRRNRSIVLNFGIFWSLFGHFYTLTGFSRHFVHNSNLNYMHMLQCT